MQRRPYSVAVIDPEQPLPVYVQLKALLLDEIVRGAFGHDGQLPTEHELCRQYAVSRTPVHRALAELADQGVILRHRRRAAGLGVGGRVRRFRLPARA